MKIKDKDDEFSAIASGKVAETTLGLIVRERIAQREKTKRLLILVVCFLFSIGILAILFSPPEKEVIGWILGVVLIVLALGAIGSAKFLLKVPGASLNTYVHGNEHHRDVHLRIRDDD